jgi:tetratricopeptide (TPR) repeat protein
MRLVLKVFEGYGAEVNLGDPLVFRVLLMNTENLEGYQRNRAIDEDIQELDAKLEANEITQEEYDQEKTTLEERKTQLDYMEFGSEKQHWSEQIRFTPDWLKPRLLSYEPEENTITVSPNLTAYALFGYTPEEIRKLPTGDHTIKAKLGEIESNEVAVSIPGEKKEPEEEEYASKARYLLMVGAASEGLQLINRLLESQPTHIDGLILKGDYYAETGDRDEAMAAYQLALEAYNATGPNEDDPPRVIIHKMNRLVSMVDSDTS